jgi:MYXO-CTERM domain-containing protein
MKKLLIVALPLFVLCASVSLAAPSYLDAHPVTGAWTIGLTGSDATAWNWNVTLNAVTGFYGGTIKDAQGFIVYDNNAGTGAGSDLGWSLSNLENGASVQWKRTAQQNYLLPGAANHKSFFATINHLDDPSKVVFHVREVDARGRVTTYFAREGGSPPTPELSTWMLLGLSGLAGVVARRRRKS